MTPSFYSMFSRSDYRRAVVCVETDKQRETVTANSDETDLENPSLEKRREEKERFAVTAIAFCLEYDLSFKNHFLSVLLRNTSNLVNYKSKKWHIEIEPKQSSDLILKTDGLVIVVEHKIDSELKPHQDPWNDPFKDGARRPRGYAIQIREEHSGAKILYRVLSKKEPFKPRQVSEIDCAAIQWHEILLPDEKPRSLHKDLYNCLAKFGVATFTFRHMNTNLRLAKQAIDAAKVFTLLRYVSEEAGLKVGEMSENDTGWDKEDDYYSFGLPLKDRSRGNDSTRASRLWNLVSPTGTEPGWFGYEKQRGEPPALVVHFYCGSRGTQQKILSKLEQSKVGKTEPGDDLNVRVSCDAARSPGDKGWFLQVFDALVPKTPALTESKRVAPE